MESDFIQQIGDKINLDWIMDRKINFEAGIGCRLKCGGCYMRFNMSPKATGTPLKKYYSQAWDRRYNIPFEKYKIIFG